MRGDVTLQRQQWAASACQLFTRTPPCKIRHTHTAHTSQGGVPTGRCIPLQHCLFTPELQWQSRGRWRISQGWGGSPVWRVDPRRLRRPPCRLATPPREVRYTLHRHGVLYEEGCVSTRPPPCKKHHTPAVCIAQGGVSGPPEAPQSLTQTAVSAAQGPGPGLPPDTAAWAARRSPARWPPFGAMGS